ncbi:MAG: patatin-like phospholipase family protein [Bacteroidota bacterium]|jgi:NTE family protein|nr:patatin-like phospholipase family protein [Bacteroidota bacterium]MCA6444608.1 patatin-like phospholipase family protein [Bacteroidota bacterium]
MEIKNIGLALQGGGAHGAFTWGVLDRLLEVDEIVAQTMCGTSAGAVNAVAVAYGLHVGGPPKAKQLLEELWRRIALSGSFLFKPGMLDKTYGNGDIYNSPGYMWFNAVTQIMSPYNFNPFNYNPLRDILNDLIDFKELQLYNKKKLFICATNVKTNRSKIFTNKEITVDAVMASACLPFLFQAVEIEGEYYWDGGYMGNPPIFPLITNTNIRDIVLIKINSININSVPTTARDIADRVNEISFNSSLINEMKLIHYRNELIRNGILKADDHANREIFVHTISGYEALSQLSYSSKMNTSWEFLLNLKEKGRAIADQWIKDDYDQLGLRSTFDVEEHFFGKL